MFRSTAGGAGALLFMAALLVLASSPASADDRGCVERGRPACSILRPPTPVRAAAGSGVDQCVVLVGGLGSETGRDDHFFDRLVAGLRGTAGYRFIRFGLEPDTLGHSFDTYGAIGTNARSLRALVRDLSASCRSIDVLTHSMGGAVADRAFSMGLAEIPGVTTYLPLSAPHNGAFAARAVRLGVGLDDTYASLASSLAVRTGLHDPTTAAVRDLALARAPRPPRVPTVRQRLVSDLFVLRRDHVDRRADVREYRLTSLQELEGHGGIVHNTHVQAVIERALREHAIPAEERSAAEIEATALASHLVDRYWGGVVASAGLALAAASAGSAVGSGMRDAVDELRSGDPAGAIEALGDDAAQEIRRLADAAPDAIELADAALALRESLPQALAAELLETARE